MVFAEVFGALLLALGFVTRFAALTLVSRHGRGWRFSWSTRPALHGDHSGELAFLYLAGFVTLLLAGGGKFSVDKAAFRQGKVN